MQSSLTVVAAVACLLVASATLHAQDAPRWQFEAGETLAYEVLQSTNVEVEAGAAGSFVTNSEQQVEVVWHIDSVDDTGVARGTQKIDRIRLTINMPSGLDMNYDSQTGEQPSGLAAMLTPMFETLLENEVAIAVSPTGEVIECKLPDAMAERLAGVPATRAMSDLVTGAGVRNLAEQIALPLPGEDEPAAREFRVENRILGTLQGELTWQSTPSDDEAIAKFIPEATLALEPAQPDEDQIASPPLESAEIARQAIDGTAEFEIQAGRLKHSTIALELQITGQLMGSEVTSDMKQTVEVTAK